MLIFGILLFTSVIFTSCGNSSNETNETIVVDSLSTTKDTLQVIETAKTEPEKIVPAKIICKIFFEDSDSFDEETGELINKGDISERDSFRKDKAYTFCYDSEDFSKLMIEGSGKELSIIIKNENKQIFKKEKFDLLDSKINFTGKDFIFEMGEKYSIIIKQNETIIFQGKIDSQGCM